MKKLYHEYFHIPKNGKISDKVMLGRTVVAALCVILCLCAFSVSTYAYYYMTVVSSGNNVQAATFEVEELRVYDGNEKVDAPEGVYSLTGGKEYTVVLQLSGSVKNAHVAIKVEAPEASAAVMAVDEGQATGGLSVGTYYTATIELDGNTKTVQFGLTVASDAKVTLQPRWGKTPADVNEPISVSEPTLLEEEEPETATPSDLEENPSFNDPVEPDTPVAPNDSTNSSDPVVPNTPTTEGNGTTDEGNAEGEGESAGGDENTGSDQSTGEGEDTSGGEGAADGAVTDEGNAADENNTVSGDETTGAEVA